MSTTPLDLSQFGGSLVAPATAAPAKPLDLSAFGGTVVKSASDATVSSTPPSDYLSKTEDAIQGATTGFVKGMGDTVSGVGHLLNKIPGVGETLSPSAGLSAMDKMDTANGTAEKVGKAAEGTAEFMLPELADAEALTGLGKATTLVELAKKYPLLADTLNLATQHPWLAKIITEGGKGAVIGGVKGAQQDQTVKGAAIGGAAGAATGAVVGGVPLLVNPFRRAASAVLASPEAVGESVAQPGAQQAIRRGVQAATENAGTADESLAANIQNRPLIGRNQTVLDEHLSSLRGLENDAYDRMDEAAGFDVKDEKSQLANDQYKLKQLGNTEADNAQKEKLNASIADSQARIADAEAKMTQAGVDPTEADALHKQRMAGVDLRKALINSTSSDGQTVNVNSLLNATKKLQFAKYGNRLEQFFGSPQAANNFMSGLEDAQKAGQKAMDARDLRNSIAKWLSVGIPVGGGVYEGTKLISHALGQ